MNLYEQGIWLKGKAEKIVHPIQGSQGGPEPLQLLKHQKEVRFQQKNNQGLRQSTDGVLGPPRLAMHIYGVLVSL